EWLVKVLATCSGATLDWDIGAGEEWARVLNGGTPVAYFRVDLPLVLAAKQRIRSWVLEEVRQVAVVVEYRNTDELEFRVELNAFDQAFPTHQWRTEVCSPDCFSANDLHWMTAT
ncbi:MAG: hypothetical protein GY835_04880, partial [bacterium]|nr:hypothetical protein [bacterium]